MQQDRICRLSAIAVFVLFSFLGGPVSAQSPGPTSFSYQGQLVENGQPADGRFDFELTLYASASGGPLLGVNQRFDVEVIEGRFTVYLDFGDTPFSGQPVWLETQVATATSGDFTTLAPRQAIVAAPQAIYSSRAGAAEDADRLDGLEADTFVRRSGDTIDGKLEVTGTATVGSLDVDDGDVIVDTVHGIVSTNGARMVTGAQGETFQFHPGAPDAHIAIFRDAGDQQVVNIDKDGQVGIGTFFPNEALSVIGNIEADGDILIANQKSLRSTGGARLTTGTSGATLQFHPGLPEAHIAIFRDANNQQVVNIDKDGKVGIGIFTPNEALSVSGNIEVGGQCFRPRQLVRCFLPISGHHLTWVENSQECLQAGGTVAGQPFTILGQC